LRVLKELSRAFDETASFFWDVGAVFSPRFRGDKDLEFLRFSAIGCWRDLLECVKIVIECG